MNNTAAENDSALVPLLNLRRIEIPSQQKHYLDPLLRSLDALIYLHAAILYICDNLSLLLLLRLSNQIVHVQFRPPTLSQLPPTIFVSIVCVVTHLLQSRTRGKRLYGGILIDFVGELTPSTWRLLTGDLIIFGLQLLMLLVGYEKQIASGDVQALEESQPQDLESEEAGQLRSHAQNEATETEEGVEMQSLLPDGLGENGSAHRKRTDPAQQDDDVILLDMKKGLKALLRRPMPVTVTSPATVESPARASLATFLARVAAARARGG